MAHLPKYHQYCDYFYGLPNQNIINTVIIKY